MRSSREFTRGRHRSIAAWPLLLLSIACVLLLTLSGARSAAALEAHADDEGAQVIAAAVEPPAGSGAMDASAFGSELNATQKAPTAAPVSVAKQPVASTPSASAASPAPVTATLESRTYIPVPEHLQDDPLQLLFSFDAASPPPQQQRSLAVIADDSAASGAYVTAAASTVLRLQRRVTSVGMWEPNTYAPHVHPMHRDDTGSGASSAASFRPPAAAPVVTTNTLNLLLSASFLRKRGSIHRSLSVSVLPGPSFARGSLAAHATRFGQKASGFEEHIVSMRDECALDVQAEAAFAATDGGQASRLHDGEERIFLQADQPSSAPTQPRLPGYGPLRSLRSMSGQAGENWVLYVSGALLPAHARGGSAADAGTEGRVLAHGVSLYALLVTAWTDPSLARAQTDAHRVALEQIGEGATASTAPPPSLNAHGLRLRFVSDFATRPFARGVRALPLFARNGHTHPMHMDPREAEPLYGKGATLERDDDDDEDEDEHPPLAPRLEEPPVYARIVDFHAYQQRKHMFIGVAYDDGFIRIFSRNGTLRTEYSTGNSTVLLLSMSNHGTSTALGPSGGGGARERDGALNGVNNGAQSLVYVTSEGMGSVRMARIATVVDSFCAWHPVHSGGITRGEDVSGIAWDPLASTVLYVVAAPSSTAASRGAGSLLVFHTRHGWNHADVASHFDARGQRKPCPPQGCPCYAAAQVRMAFASSSSPSASSPILAAPSLYSILALRGYVVVGSSASRALAVFNTTHVSALPPKRRDAQPALKGTEGRMGEVQSEEDASDGTQERGIPPTFLFERQLPAAANHRGDVEVTRLALDRLVGDRIELLVAGDVYDCERGGSCRATAASSEGAPPSVASAASSSFHSTLSLFQIYLPCAADDARPFGSSPILSSLLSSRVPLFIVGIVIMFLYQWWKKRQARIQDEARELERAWNMGGSSGGGAAGGKRRGGGVGKGSAARTSGRGRGGSSMASVNEEDADEFDPSAIAGLGNGEGKFDGQAFMADFVAWQSKQKHAAAAGSGDGGASAASSASRRGPAAAAGGARGLGHDAQYMADLAADRARLRQRGSAGMRGARAAAAALGLGSMGASASVPTASASEQARLRLEQVQRERVLMRRRLDAMDTPARAAADGLGVGGFEPAHDADAVTAEERARWTALGAASKVNDPADGMGLESLGKAALDGENGEEYDAFDEHDGAYDDAQPADFAQQQQQQEDEAAYREEYDEQQLEQDDDAYDDVDDQDGEGYTGSYDYNYDASQYADPPAAVAARERMRPVGSADGVAQAQQVRNTYPIDAPTDPSFFLEHEQQRYQQQGEYDDDAFEQDDDADADAAEEDAERAFYEHQARLRAQEAREQALEDDALQLVEDDAAPPDQGDDETEVAQALQATHLHAPAAAADADDAQHTVD